MNFRYWWDRVTDQPKWRARSHDGTFSDWLSFEDAVHCVEFRPDTFKDIVYFPNRVGFQIKEHVSYD